MEPSHKNGALRDSGHLSGSQEQCAGPFKMRKGPCLKAEEADRASHQDMARNRHDQDGSWKQFKYNTPYTAWIQDTSTIAILWLTGGVAHRAVVTEAQMRL